MLAKTLSALQKFHLENKRNEQKSKYKLLKKCLKDY